MNTLIPELLFKTKTSAVVICANDGENGYVVTLEPSADTSSVSNSVAVEKTIYKLWKTHNRHPTFEIYIQGETLMPESRFASVSIDKESIVVLFETNFSDASVFGRWKHHPSRPEVELISLEQIELPQAIAKAVAISPGRAWSTAGIPPREWLFHPRLTKYANGHVVGAFNTADARAVVWELGAPSKGHLPIAVIPFTLDPIVLKTNSKILIAWRQPPPEWSVFFNSFSYNDGGDCEALPLFLGELRGNRTIPLSDSSPESVLAKPMVFEAATDGRKKVILALIEGTYRTPQLRVILSEDEGMLFRDIGRIVLRGMPKQLSVALYHSGAIVALSTPRGEAYEVEGIEIRL